MARLGHLMNIWGSVLVIVASPWWARECWGSSWIVVTQPDTAAAAPSLPSCPSYCLQGYPSVQAGLMAGLWWCSGLGATYANEKWSFNSSSSAFFLVSAEASPICLDVANASTILAGTSQLPAASARSLVLSNCNSSSPTQKWILDNAGHLQSLAGSSYAYAYAYQAPQHNDVYFLYLIEDTFTALSFVMVDTSLADSYYKPPLPPNNQSNLILNGNLKLLTSFAPLTQPPLKSIVTDWTTVGVWDGFYFVVCHWEVHGTDLALGGCDNSVCKLPQEWCSGSNADEILLSLNSKDGKPGWIMQTVPTYPGSNYLLLFEMRNPRSQTQKLQLSVSQVVTSSAVGKASKEFEIMPYQNDSQTHQFQFIASGNFVNVSFSSQGTTDCGPLINNIQLYYWPLAAEQTVVLPNHAHSVSRLILAVTIAGWVLAATQCSGVALYIARNLWRRRHNKLTGSSASIPATPKVPITIFSFEQLKTYTENFSILIGEGGFGKVYFGRLPESNQPIAVKRQNDADNASFFQAEVALLSRVHHRYIVKFLGYCEDKGERMLVFEYMPNQSLHSRLHGESMLAGPLRWEERLRIAYQVAYALEYLHNGANPAVLHRDVKSANVLLSSNMVAKLADMGISKVGRPNEVGTSSTMTEVKGSRGYMDPYYLQTSMISHKSDVYSFGVLLLEMVTGQKVITSASELLTVWAKRVYWDTMTSDGGSGRIPHNNMNNIVDSRLRGSDVPDDAVKADMEIARSCLHEEPRHRPSMAEVARRLREQLPSAHVLHMDEFTTDDDVASTSNDTFSGR